MNNSIKIAGLGLGWSKEYAWTYKELMCEVGFQSKVIESNGGFFVAYSHKSFTIRESIEILEFISKEETDETSA